MSDSHLHSGFVAPSPADLAPLFPGYEIQGLIATGGMGAVYYAVQKSLDRTVALKILPMEFSKDAAFCASFEAEAKAMARLNHPNLISVFDFGEVQGMLFIIMEFVAGKSIYHSAHGIAIAPAEVARLVIGICNGLAHAHENGILHRDIKPSNILLDQHAQPKIGDFGLARPIERKIEVGEEIFGTPHYTAPEVVDSPHSVDYRADIFSVGVLLHELLTGKLPATDPRPASTIVPCDPRFDTIIRRATQPIPAARYSSAKEMASDLQVIATSMGKGPRVASITPNLPSPERRRAENLPKIPRTTPINGPRRVQTVRRPPPAKVNNSSPIPMIVVLLIVAGGVIAAYSYYRKLQPTKQVMPIVILPQIKPPPKPAFTPKDQHKEPPPIVAPEPDHSPTNPPHDPGVKPDLKRDEDSNHGDPIADQAAPKSDVTEFFARAKKIMQDRAKPTSLAYRTNLTNNFADFEIALNRQLRKMKSNGPSVNRDLDVAVESLRNDSGRIPDALRGKLDMVDNADAIREEYHAKEIGIDDQYHQDLSKLAPIYILGLEKQIERLKADNDTGAIALIQSEIVQTKESPEYFPSLLLSAD